jgi:hypothetical protein
VAPPQAGHRGGGGVLDHPDLLRLPAHLRADGGGPANATHLLATYAYQIGIATGLLGEGAAISLFMLPVLFIVVWVQLRYLRAERLPASADARSAEPLRNPARRRRRNAAASDAPRTARPPPPHGYDIDEARGPRVPNDGHRAKWKRGCTSTFR